MKVDEYIARRREDLEQQQREISSELVALSELEFLGHKASEANITELQLKNERLSAGSIAKLADQVFLGWGTGDNGRTLCAIPYLELQGTRIFTSVEYALTTPEFRAGNGDLQHYERAGWEEEMRAEGVSEEIIEKARGYLTERRNGGWVVDAPEEGSESAEAQS